jgi:hypothetical protein
MQRTVVHRQDHPLAQAHTPTLAPGGTVVDVVCSCDGRSQRLVLALAPWQAERRRRRRSSARLDAAVARREAAADDLDAAWARQRQQDARWEERGGDARHHPPDTGQDAWNTEEDLA